MSNEERLITERLKGIEYAIKVLNEEKDKYCYKNKNDEPERTVEEQKIYDKGGWIG